jgi:hypothetical protein
VTLSSSNDNATPADPAAACLEALLKLSATT